MTGQMQIVTRPQTVFTVGHSTHSIERFIKLLREAGITAIADVRSVPYSRHLPHFNRPGLKRSLNEAGIAYVFLGRELGARPDDRSCYRGQVAEYDLIARSAAFQAGLDRVVKGSHRYRIALMCAEKEPLDCHRTILVGRHLVGRGVHLVHIHADGRLEPHADTERRLLKKTGEDAPDLFAGAAAADPLSRAYAKRGRDIAYVETVEESPA